MPFISQQRMLCRYGTAGFCRTGSYGMPQFVTNTIRLCTKDTAGSAMHDATVPVRPLYRVNGSDTTTTTAPSYDSIVEQCSDNPYDVPWSFDNPDAVENPAAMFSLGNVPMWDGSTLASNSEYPQTMYAGQMYNTNPGSVFTSWGDDCTDGELLKCDKDSDCMPLANTNVKLQCKHGVCVMDMAMFPSCYSHADCQGSNQMCSGDGKCVDMVLQVCNPRTLWLSIVSALCLISVPQVENHLEESIEFELYAKECSGSSTRSYDTYGASAWENIPDVLGMYGLCSYRNWFEYLEFVDPTVDERKNQGACTDQSKCDPASFNTFLSLWWDTQRDFSETSMQTLYDTRKFQVTTHSRRLLAGDMC